MSLLDDLGHRNLVEGSFHSSPREQMQTMRSSVLPICERRTEVFRLSISEKPCIFPSRTPRRHLAIRRIIWRITKIAVHCLGQLVAVRKRRTAGAAVAADSSGAAYAGEELESPRSSAGRFLLPRSGVIVCFLNPSELYRSVCKPRRRPLFVSLADRPDWEMYCS